jgi:hypothetical protein
MRHLIALALMAFTLSVLGQTQTTESLRKENGILKEQLKKLKDDTLFLNSKLKFCAGLTEHKELEIKQISNSVTTRILSCLGDRNSQTVTIEFVVSHKILHQSLCIANDPTNVKAFDEMGNELPVRATDIGSGGQKDLFGSGKCNKIPTDVPVKCFVILRNVMPGTDVIKFLTVALKFRNYDSTDDYTYGNLEVKNLIIKW